jgi:hypothetical protein
MILHIDLGNFNVILFVVLVAAAVAVAAVLSAPSLLHSVALFCLVRRDAILAHRRTVANLKEEWRRGVPYPGDADAPAEPPIAAQPVTAAGR